MIEKRLLNKRIENDAEKIADIMMEVVIGAFKKGIFNNTIQKCELNGEKFSPTDEDVDNMFKEHKEEYNAITDILKEYGSIEYMLLVKSKASEIEKIKIRKLFL